MNLPAYLAEHIAGIDQILERRLPEPPPDGCEVRRAMRYAVLGGGKRLRPILAIASHAACGGALSDFAEVACALELIHTYSLIHDDLPSLDDDDLRRGRPTVHRVFGEAQAILAGDALLTLAFELLGGRPAGDEHALGRTASIVTVARAAGVAGMVGGQASDLAAEHRQVGAEQLRWIHRRKTGALFAASAELGAIHADADAERRKAMASFGEGLGLAFQITDDVLDLTASPRSLGKTPGKDLDSGKATYPALIGLEASTREARSVMDRALDRLRPLSLASPMLQSLAGFAVNRAG